MKNLLLNSIATFLLLGNAYCQEDSTKLISSKRVSEVINKNINFVVGVGLRLGFTDLYREPYVNSTNNYVNIEKSSKLSSNISLGIVYTPFLYRIKNSKEEYFAYKGVSFATFISPGSFGSITKSSENTFFEYVDFGVGLGYKFVSGIMIMATIEFVSVMQPNDTFIDKYKENNLEYLVDGNIQKSFDLNDRSVFHNELIPTLGFKFCYTFDIVNSFTKASKDI